MGKRRRTVGTRGGRPGGGGAERYIGRKPMIPEALGVGADDVESAGQRRMRNARRRYEKRQGVTFEEFQAELRRLRGLPK